MSFNLNKVRRLRGKSPKKKKVDELLINLKDKVDRTKLLHDLRARRIEVHTENYKSLAELRKQTYYQRNREAIVERMREWRRANPEKVREINRKAKAKMRHNETH